MALSLRPGVYRQEIDNSITMSAGGLGGIGVCGRFEKGEIGVAVDAPDRETLERQFGLPIAGFNQEDYAYVDNIFYYSGNLVLSRIEDTEWKYRRGLFTVPAENAQALIYEKDGIAFNCGNSFNLTALSKDVYIQWDDGTDDDWENLFRDNANIYDYAILMKNSTENFKEKYEGSVDSKTRTAHTASLDLYDDLSKDPSSSEENIYNLTQNIRQIKNGSLLVDKDNKKVAKISGMRKVVLLSNDEGEALSGDIWNDANDEIRVFSVPLVKLSELAYFNTYSEYSRLDNEASDSDEIYVFDYKNTSFTEIGSYLKGETGELGGVYLKNENIVLKDGQFLIPLKASEIENADAVDEESKIMELLIDKSSDKEFTDSSLYTTYFKVKIASDTTSATSVVLSESDPASVVLSEEDPTPVVLEEGSITNINSVLSFNYIMLGNKNFDGETATVDVICNNSLMIFENITINIDSTSAKEFCRVVAKTAGKWADSMKISVMVCPMVMNGGISLFDEFASQYFDFRPEGTGNEYNADQIAVVVFVDGSAMEKYIVSVNPEAKDADGMSIYWNDAINRSSQYIYFGINPDYVDSDANLVKLDMLSDYIPEIVMLSGGNSSMKINPASNVNNVKYSVDKENIQAFKEALKVFSNKESVSIEYLCDGAFAGSSQVKDALVDMAVNTRNGDCVVVLGTSANEFQGVHYANEGYARIESKYVPWVNSSAQNQYVAFYANSKQVYDSVNDSLVWISCSSDGVGLNSRVDRLQERWYAVAGVRRGVLTNTLKLGWYPDDTSREKMTKDRMNPVIYERGDGNMIYDTMSICSLNSILSEFYNRKTLNFIEQNTENTLKQMLFEMNDETTRSQIVATLTPFYRSIYNRRGLAEPAQIICDDSLNTPDIVNQGLCIVAISLRLQNCIKRILCQYKISASSVSLESETEA